MTRRTDYLHISVYSAQQDLSGDGHLAMYVMTNQNGPCFVRVNRRAEVQTQMFVGERHRVLSRADPGKY